MNEGPKLDWREVVTSFEKDTPRVGNAYFWDDDPRVVKVQQHFPQISIKFVLTCRGTERYRVPKPDIARENIPLLKTVVVNRQSGEIQDLGEFEEWQRISKAKQTRKAVSARLSLSVFGKLGLMGVSEGEVGSNPEQDMEIDAPKSSQDGSLVPSSMALPTENRIQSVADAKAASCSPVPGWAPKIIPRHGPAFRALEPQQRADLARLHHNLGHPDPARLQRLLIDQGAENSVIQGALDMQCDVCLETQRKPKLPHPSAVHDDLDFNDVVGADGAHWKSKLGHTYHFMHFIDEGTLFHLGAPSGRTVEEQIRVFEDVWLQWAGPCKTMYLDPAGEYVSPKWNDRLQQENIKSGHGCW
jgi:hypothetical protein